MSTRIAATAVLSTPFRARPIRSVVALRRANVEAPLRAADFSAKALPSLIAAPRQPFAIRKACRAASWDVPHCDTASAAPYKEQCAADVRRCEQLLRGIEHLVGAKTVASVLEPLDELGQLLGRSLGTAELFANVHPDADVRTTADGHSQILRGLATQLSLSRPLYDALVSVEARFDSSEGADTQRMVRRNLRALRRAGVDRDAATRATLAALQQQLVVLEQQFGNAIREDVRAIHVAPEALRGLPSDFVAKHPAGPDGLVTITTNYPDLVPFMSYSEDDGARLALLEASQQRGYPANGPVLTAMLTKRQELARLLGYANYADMVTEDAMIQNGKAAQEFIDRVSTVAKPRAQRDYNELLAFLKARNPKARSVGAWQKAFAAEGLRRTKYKLDATELRPYFVFGKVRQGLFELTGSMFGLSYQRLDVPVWHPSVEAYAVRDASGQVIGQFYLDLHPRESKYQHAAMFPMATGVVGKHLPEAALVCNFPAGDDALMEHSDVKTFFHEFGHLLHHILAGGQRWSDLGGISTEQDFIEAPSQLLEEWTYDPAALRLFATDAAGTPLPAHLVEALRGARDFGEGLAARQQMMQAALSLQLHQRDTGTTDIDALVGELQQRYSLFAPVADTHFPLSFGHLAGYSACYYTYMWSLVIAKDFYAEFVRGGTLNPAVAQRYRDCVLAPGGSKDAAELIRGFLGRSVSFDAFACWLEGS